MHTFSKNSKRGRKSSRKSKWMLVHNHFFPKVGPWTAGMPVGPAPPRKPQAGVYADTPRPEGHLTSVLSLHLGYLSALLGAAPPSESKDPPHQHPGKQQLLELEMVQPFQFCRGESSLEMENTKNVLTSTRRHTLWGWMGLREQINILSPQCWNVHHLSVITRPLPSHLSDNYVILINVSFGVLNIFSVYMWSCCQMLYFIHHGPTTKYLFLWRSFCRRELGLF